MTFISRFVVISDGSRYGNSFEDDTRKKLKEDAAKAGYDDVEKYMVDLLTPARLYQECIADPFAERSLCMYYKKLWLERKTARNRNKVAWNEEEVHKMIKEDAARAGHKDGYYPMKDPKYPKIMGFLYEECVSKSVVEDSLCEVYKTQWLQSMSVLNGKEVSLNEAEIRKMMKKDAAVAGYGG